MADTLFAHITAAWPDPDRVALVLPEGPSVTFGEIRDTAARMAHVLVENGVMPGDRVAVQTEKSPEALMLYLATLRAGAVYLPLNTGYTPNELAYFVADAAPKVFVCTTTGRQAIEASVPPVTFLTLDHDGRGGSLIAACRSVASEFSDADMGPDSLAAILYTSGTTGRSKGAMLSQGNLLTNAGSLIQAWAMTADDVLLHALPIYHIHGLFVACNTALLSGGRMIFLPKFDPDKVFESLPGATVMMGVPTFYTRLLKDSRLTREATRHMRLFVSGSAPLLPETHAQWRERTGHTILERYGMTETGMNTSNPYDGVRMAGSVGRPLPGVELRIANDQGEPLPAGKIGMIEVRGPNVFQGYWRMPEKTAAEFRPDGYFITGDLGSMDDQGYVRILGRGKDLIISGGLNVYPREIEEKLDNIPGVEESAVVGLPHEDFGEAVTAFLVPKPGASLREDAVLAALSGQVARFKCPKKVVVVDALPRNSMGKVQKSILRADFKNLYR